MKDDVISRQAAIDAMAELQGRASTKAELKGISKAWKRIKWLPSAQHKKGKWNFIGDNMFECSECGVPYTTEQLNSLRNYDTDPYLPRFCPHCGSDMRGEENV